MAKTFDRPFPALTPAQRYHLEIFGYVVVPDVLSPDECGTILEALQRIKRDYRANPQAPYQPGDSVTLMDLPHHWSATALLESDAALTAFVTHPRLVSMAEELIGGEARLVEYNCHINSRDPHADLSIAPRYGFHTGIDVPFGSYTNENLFQCGFVKTLTNLTDLGPDDGGTVVVAGSHKLHLGDSLLAECAYADPKLIHQVIAPAGSTLLFAETLIHATGQIRSDNERAIIIAGSVPRMFSRWDNGEMSEEFIASVPPEYQTYLLGKAHWTRAEKYRTLDQPADERKFTLADGWWPNQA